jgi:hypothetical protein
MLICVVRLMAQSKDVGLRDLPFLQCVWAWRAIRGAGKLAMGIVVGLN